MLLLLVGEIGLHKRLSMSQSTKGSEVLLISLGLERYEFIRLSN